MMSCFLPSEERGALRRGRMSRRPRKDLRRSGNNRLQQTRTQCPARLTTSLRVQRISKFVPFSVEFM